MPPLSIGEIWNRSKELVGLISGSGKAAEGEGEGEGDAHDSVSGLIFAVSCANDYCDLTFTSLQQTTAHSISRADPTRNNTDFQEIDAPGATTKKRKVVARVQIPSNKRQDTRSEHERRLTGDYSNPADATPIHMPGVFDGAQESHAAGRGKMSKGSKPGGGGFKAMNTLSQGTWQGQKPVNGAHVRPGPKRTHVLHPSLTYQERSHGSTSGEGFSNHEWEGAPAQKRRKLARTGHTDLPSDPIALDEEDEEEATASKVIAVNGKAICARIHDNKPQRVRRSEPRNAPFDNAEFQTVDQYTRLEQPKRPRKAVNGNASSQASSRASPAIMTNGLSRPPNPPGPEVVVLDDDTSQEISQSHASDPLSSDRRDQLPDVKDIANGVFETKEAKRRRESDNSIEFTHAQRRARMPPPAVVDIPGQTGQRHRPRQQQRHTITQDGLHDILPRASVASKDDVGREKPQIELKERRLDQTFKRDPATSPLKQANGTARRRDAMKADSDRAGSKSDALRDSIGSIDELNGPTTIGSASPEKQQYRAEGPATHVDDSRSSRSLSPSNLKSTHFTSSKRDRPPQKSRAIIRRDPNDREDEPSRMPLLAFFSTSCCLMEGNIMMCHTAGSNTLTIEKDNVQVAILGGECAVQITSADANEINWDRETTMVYLKGSASSVSNGRICINFEDITGREWFVRRLVDICTVTPTSIVRSTEDIVKLWQIQTKQIGQVYNKQRDIAARNKALVDKIEAKKSQKRLHNDVDDDDTIRREVHEPRRASVRTRMLQGAPDDDRDTSNRAPLPKALQRSPYFDDSVPRRSTRQAKPVKPRSPTPPPIEKWTKTNKQGPWPHSVVYPPGAARRATVDFQDLERLDEGEFLNDNIISFALRQIEEKMKPEHRKRVHFFNSFFYTALTTKNGKKAFNYDAVKRWTKSEDLLGYDYVVVPINIDLHWFVAIICNLPNISRRPKDEEEDDEVDDTPGAAEASNKPHSDTIEPPEPADREQSAAETSENTKAMRNLSISDDEGTSTRGPLDKKATPPQPSTAADGEVSSTTKRQTTAVARKGKKRGPPSYDPDEPAIITVDSFAAAHTGEIRNLKDYLRAEAEAKRGIALDTAQLQGMTVKNPGVPTQTNFCDCGVFLVGYVEEFAKNPRDFATKALQRTLGQNQEFDDFDPSSKRDEIREELLALQRVQEAEHKAKKASKKTTVKQTDGQHAASANATPKPESNATSKAASPEKDSAQPSSVVLREEPKKVKSWKLPEAVEPPAQPVSSQEKDLEYVVPRALEGSLTRGSEGLPQADEKSEEMLDEPGREAATENSSTVEEAPPNPLLDDFGAELDFHAQLQQAAAFEPETLSSSRRPDRTQRQQRVTRRAKSLSGEVDEGPEQIRKVEVINIDDSQEGITTRVEIPDSQEQQQRRGQRAGTP